MDCRGFVNHAVTGALLLGGLWFALNMPLLARASAEGAWPRWLLVVIFAVGVLGGPCLMLVFGGDEIFGCLGVVVALLLGLGGAYLAVHVFAAPGAREAIRLSGAALGPILLYSGIRVSMWLAERKEDGQGS
jgi:hypothetical protein